MLLYFEARLCDSCGDDPNFNTAVKTLGPNSEQPRHHVIKSLLHTVTQLPVPGEITFENCQSKMRRPSSLFFVFAVTSCCLVLAAESSDDKVKGPKVTDKVS